MISDGELREELYNDLLSECQTFEDEINTLRGLKNEKTDSFKRIYCDDVLYVLSHGYIKYDQSRFDKDETFQLFLQAVNLLPKKKEFAYFHLISYYFKRENEKCLSLLEEYIESLYEKEKEIIKKPDDFMNETRFVYFFFEPFKQAFSGFWSKLAKILRKYPSQTGLPEICDAVEQYYICKTDDEALDLLLDMAQKYPDSVLIKELVGYTYYSMKMWNNAIAYFESVEETGIVFPEKKLYFMLAWSYGKIKDRKREEEYYRKTLQVNSDDIDATNNLGYNLYLQKKYEEAISYFSKCLEMDASYGIASNNYVRTLITLGRNEEAKSFVESGKYKVAKELKRRVDKLDDTTLRKTEEDQEELIELLDDESLQENTIELGVKRQQFSSERLLEDELTLRIESGMEVFGLKLKMYKRKGVYGRQFIIPIGRLDLLCEDDKGNLYVIEVKKDSGYGDVYRQIVSYLDWFENNKKFNGQKIYGIICLNSPTKKLINNVRRDKRIRLFEYHISYKEV